MNFQNNYHKLTSNEFTTRWLAGVPSESLPRLNERSIATSVMAGLLGCPDLVAQAQKARTGTGADAKDGLFMETAGGINGNSLRTKLKESDWKTRGCAPNVKRQLADMQILDLICGQCDRHANNIMWETDANGYPISIKGIDHDMSFGVFDVEARGESASHLGLVRVVDQKTYEFVENLAKPENRALIEYKFKDLLGEKEIDALWGRIDTMARWLKQDAVRKVQPEEWSTLQWKDLALKTTRPSETGNNKEVDAENIFSRVSWALFRERPEEIAATDDARLKYAEGIDFEKAVRRQRDLEARNLRAQQAQNQAAVNPQGQERATQDPQAQKQTRVIRSGP